ncbi:unnamed protein product [Paramecium primaurelia]|uniref:Uncharacterized protein n=1 Tax=Paramecium primaurelia TaxID=5886 RepID=A0A8S1LST2_PARPR|nr:unnamed protein product [Paramecium primaurelia]
MGCAPSAIQYEKVEFLKDDLILSDDLELSDETCANLINDSIRVNESILNRKTLYKEEIEDFQIMQEQQLNQKPFIIKSCFKRNNKTQQIMQKEKKVRFCKSYQININGLKFIVKKKEAKKKQKRIYNKII